MEKSKKHPALRRTLQIFALLVLLAALLFGYTLLRYTGKAACGIVGNRVDTNAPAPFLYLHVVQSADGIRIDISDLR